MIASEYFYFIEYSPFIFENIISRTWITINKRSIFQKKIDSYNNKDFSEIYYILYVFFQIECFFLCDLYNIIFKMAFNKAYLFAYMTLFLIISVPFTCMGSLIPFLAEDLNIDQTEYAGLFLLISISSFIAAFGYKLMQAYHIMPNIHHKKILCLLGMGAFSACFAYSDTIFWQFITTSILNMFANVTNITTNVCLVLAAPIQSTGLWVSFSHGVFGIGALVAPVMVALLQQKIFMVTAGACLIMVPCLYWLPAPESEKPESKEETEHKQKMKNGSKKLEILLCLGFFISVGIEVTIQGWIPTYAVETGIKTKEQAVQFTSIFWIINTIFRFVFGYLKATDTIKFKSLILEQLSSGIICAFLAVCRFPAAASYLCSILYGISLSQLFALLLSLPSEYNLFFSGSQLSNMMVVTVFSQGVFASLTGVLMKWDLNMFFYSLVVFSLIYGLLAKMTLQTLNEQKQVKEQIKQLEMALVVTTI